MRAAIRALPDGVWEGEDWVDDDGVDDRPIRIRVRVEIAGDEARFDFTGTSPQVRGPVNTTYYIACSAVYYAMKALVAPDVPPNDGCYRPLHVHVPPRHRPQRGSRPSGRRRQSRDLPARRRRDRQGAGTRPARPRLRRRADHVGRPDLRRAAARRPLVDPLRGSRRRRGRDRREGRRLGGARPHVQRHEHADRGHRGRVPDHARGAGAPPRLRRRRRPSRRPRIPARVPDPGAGGHAHEHARPPRRAAVRARRRSATPRPSASR